MHNYLHSLSRYLNIYVGMPDVEEGFNITKPISPHEVGTVLPTCTLDDQKQMDSKPAGQPEHASLNQCQLIAANRPEIGARGTPSWRWR